MQDTNEPDGVQTLGKLEPYTPECDAMIKIYIQNGLRDPSTAITKLAFAAYMLEKIDFGHLHKYHSGNEAYAYHTDGCSFEVQRWLSPNKETNAIIAVSVFGDPILNGSIHIQGAIKEMIPGMPMQFIPETGRLEIGSSAKF
jgi:hypothetical protein